MNDKHHTGCYYFLDLISSVCVCPGDSLAAISCDKLSVSYTDLKFCFFRAIQWRELIT